MVLSTTVLHVIARHPVRDRSETRDADCVRSKGSCIMSAQIAGIPVKRTRVRKPVAPRTCCATHTDTCRFGRDHVWSLGWIGGPKSGIGVGEEGWHDSAICSTCLGVCVADLEAGQEVSPATEVDIANAALAPTQIATATAPGVASPGPATGSPRPRRDTGIAFNRREGSTTEPSTGQNCGVTVEYLSLQGVADHLGVSRNTIAKYKLPEPDVRVGTGLNAPRGWSVATIDEWNAQRPGRGARTDLAGSKGKK